MEHYKGREQSGAKHDLLRRYLQPLAYKILSWQNTITYIDGFSGPWESRDAAEFTDTSFGVAISTLGDVVADMRKRNPSVRARLIFNEANPVAYSQLRSHVEAASVRWPQLEMHTLNGPFVENARQMQALSRGSFRLIFVDPTGWKGVAIEALQKLAEGRSETILNFMTDHINRFLTLPRDEREAWLNDLFGAATPAQFPAEEISIQELQEGMREAFKQVLKYDYVCSSRIAMARADREHFILFYGSRNPAGPETLRKAEIDAFTKYDAVRERIRNGKQGTLFPMPRPISYQAERERHLAELQDTCVDLATSMKALTFDKFAARVQERNSVRRSEIGRAIAALAAQGRLQATWKSRGPRCSRPGKTDLIQLPLPKDEPF